jgi:acyl-CoA dehydrogenase
MDPNTKLFILIGRTPNADLGRHQQHSQILIPAEAPGIEIVRPLGVLGSFHGPGGHCEITFDNVRVPASNLLLGEGRGFEIAQGRLGPGRIHHCMRLVGQAQRALEYMVRRAESRVAFGRKLSEQGSIRQDIALSFCEIEQARLLTFKAADAMDRYGNKVAKDLIAAIKIVAPRMSQTVADRAIQIHGAIGLTDDFPVAEAFSNARFLRFADGPDEVHMAQLAKLKIAELGALPKR